MAYMNSGFKQFPNYLVLILALQLNKCQEGENYPDTEGPRKNHHQ